MYSPVSDPAELDEVARIRWRLWVIEQTHLLYCRLAEKPPLPKSQLAADDKATGWLRVSHQVRSYLNMATDSMRALLAMLIVGEKLEIPLQAHYPVIRTALEGAAQAKWILSPDQHRERVRRSLSAHVTEERQDAKLYAAQRAAILLHSPSAADEMAKADRLEAIKNQKTMTEIRRCSDALQLEWATVSNGAPGMEPLLRAVSEAGNVPGEYAASVWKVLSGLSHPSSSRAVRHAHVEELSESQDGVISVHVTASLNHTHQGLLVAQAAFTDAVTLYQRRLIAPFGGV